MSHRTPPADKSVVGGMTMIETMVAMAISSVLVLGSISIYNNARASYRTAENLARLQESLRFATDTLDRDVRLAGYWGRMNEGIGLVRNPEARVTCVNNDVTAWALDERANSVDASDDNYDLVCPGINPRANSDVLVVRHVTNDLNVEPDANRIQVQTNGVGGVIFANGIAPLGDDAELNNRQQVYDVAVNAYYISNESKYDNNLPSLRRRALNGMTMEDQEIIAGVENMQVQVGIDRNVPPDGQADGYVDADNPEIRADNVVSVRLWLLVRGDADESAQGFSDDKAYPTPDADGFVITPDNGVAYPNKYRRFAFTRTIKLENL